MILQYQLINQNLVYQISLEKLNFNGLQFILFLLNNNYKSLPALVKNNLINYTLNSENSSQGKSFQQLLRRIIFKFQRKNHGQNVKSIFKLASGWFDWKIWKPVFNILAQVPAQRIYFSNFRFPDILYEVVHISFPNLREIHIEDNFITSIQPLVAFDIPKLKKLDLRRNKIIDISCLKRCQFPNLQQLNLSDNDILSCVPLAECYFPQLRNIIIQEKSYLNIYLIYQEGRGQRQLRSHSNVNGYDLRWIIKLESPCVQTIRYSADSRIIRNQLQRQIGHKYYKVRVQKKGMELGSLLPLLSF